MMAHKSLWRVDLLRNLPRLDHCVASVLLMMCGRQAGKHCWCATQAYDLFASVRMF